MPQPRGDLSTSLAEKTVADIAPESPRPASLLDRVKITGEDNLTANDVALHELLLSHAYEVETELRKAGKPLPETHTIPVSWLLRYLGPTSRRDALNASLRRLAETVITFGSKSSLYEDMQLLVSWCQCDGDDNVIAFSFPPPIRDLMRTKQRYAYLELVPLAMMKSRYSIRLYKRLALEASKHKWSPAGENLITLSGAPAEVAAWAGFQPESGIVTTSKLRDRVLKFMETDFAALRAFSVSFREIYGTGRGRPVERFEFRLHLKAPSHHLASAQFERDEHKLKGVGGMDAPEYQVNSHIWQKAQSQFGKAIPEKYTSYHYFFQAWLLALEEAITEDAWSPAYERRNYRGPRLLTAIEKLGANEAAWQFCCEEAASPDFLEDHDFLNDQSERLKKTRNERIAAFLKAQNTPPSPEDAYPSYIEEIGNIDISGVSAEMLAELLFDDDKVVPNTPVGTVTLPDFAA
ncbi:replication initiation protein [Brucella sp. HL-2]|nr:replication initiation protein [Brucella sp. HL-2]MCV9910381.1 replication initiation protein [Brucella sp. HL-2]